MNAAITSFEHLPDDQLLATVSRLAAAERRASAALIRSLMELDARRLYLGEGCSSMFTYCTQVLHLAEGAAYNRIETARASRRFPAILECLEDGSLTMTSVRLLAPHLTPDNHVELLASARGKSKGDVERLIASLRPKPDVRAAIRKLPPARNGALAIEVASASPLLDCPARGVAPTALPAQAHAPRPVAPLAPGRYKLQLTMSEEAHEKLSRVRELMRHSVPSGDLAEIFDRALTLLLDDLRRRRCAATASPRTARPPSGRSRHIPAHVRRHVWERDGGRCAFVGPNGRCAERSFLELHHVHPYAEGGTATVENIELRCRAHNAYEASLFFGADHISVVREDRERYRCRDNDWSGTMGRRSQRTYAQRPRQRIPADSGPARTPCRSATLSITAVGA